jgi:hypothetical protein
MALAACSDVTAPSTLQAPTNSRNEKIQDTREPSALTVTNPCNGDVIVLTGETHTVVELTVGGNGTTHSKTDIDSKYTGTGLPSGFQYKGTNSYSDDFAANNPFPLEETLKTSLKLESSGKGGSFTQESEIKIKIDGNGNVQKNISNFTTKCNGK